MSDMERVMELDADITLDDIDVELEMQEIMQGSNDYLELINLPSINNTPLKGNYDEIDPTVPQWAKEPNKPHYSASEVGAMVEGSAYTKEETNALLNAKADRATTYTKSEVDNLIDNVSVDVISDSKINAIVNKYF